MGQMKDFSLWMAQQIHVMHHTVKEAFAEAKKIWNFDDDADLLWFHKQYKAGRAEEIGLRVFRDTVHFEDTKEEIELKQWIRENEEQLGEEWREYYDGQDI